jgi:26S proteasome non-ATPase regulatory subunit 9
MKAGDHVLRLGTVNWMNHDKLAKLAEVVAQNEGVLVPAFLNSLLY